ncbi:MAG: hypothetical protein WB760_09115 [Xanthobacteraceae bacterium]
MAEKSEANSTDEIEITEAMIEAGRAALAAYHHEFELPWDAVKRIYVCMERVRRSLSRL